jgi:dihydroxy-acid dehydratase
VGGPLALVKTGDRIRLDVPARRLEALIDEAELKKRAAAWRAPAVADDARRGYAKLYREHVQQADQGCDFDFLTATKK